MIEYSACALKQFGLGGCSTQLPTTESSILYWFVLSSVLFDRIGLPCVLTVIFCTVLLHGVWVGMGCVASCVFVFFMLRCVLLLLCIGARLCSVVPFCVLLCCCSVVVMHCFVLRFWFVAGWKIELNKSVAAIVWRKEQNSFFSFFFFFVVVIFLWLKKRIKIQSVFVVVDDDDAIVVCLFAFCLFVVFGLLYLLDKTSFETVSSCDSFG